MKLKHIGIPFAFLIAFVLAGCGSDSSEEDTDPGLPFSVGHVMESSGIAYAGALVYPERNKTNSNYVLIAVDLRRLFLEREPLTNSRFRNDKRVPNVTIWDMGRIAPRIKLDENNLAGVELPADSSTPIRVHLIELEADAMAPALSTATTLPDSAGYFPEHSESLGDGNIFVHAWAGTGQPTVNAKTYVVAPKTGNVRSVTEGAACRSAHVINSRFYCTQGDGQIKVYSYTTATGVGTPLSSFTLSEATEIISSYVGLDETIHAIDIGLSSPLQPSVFRVAVESGGGLHLIDRVETPKINGDLTIVHKGLPITADSSLLGTTHGVVVFNYSTKSVVATATTDLSSVIVGSASGLDSGHYLAAHPQGGLSLLKLEGASLSRLGTYYRRWGDKFPNYSTIQEGVY